MASSERIFFTGVATSALLIGLGFGGGILLGRAALEPVQQTKTAESKTAPSGLAERSLPPARVVLPALTEATSRSPTLSAPTTQEAAPITSEPHLTSSQDDTPVASEKADEKEKQAEHPAQAENKKAETAERRKKAADRDRHRRYTERRARQDAALEPKRVQEPPQAAPRRRAGPFGMLAFDDGSQPPRPAGFFGY
jgi:hypothetical protein